MKTLATRFKEWINELLAEASKLSNSSSSETDESLQSFVDHIGDRGTGGNQWQGVGRRSSASH